MRPACCINISSRANSTLVSEISRPWIACLARGRIKTQVPDNERMRSGRDANAAPQNCANPGNQFAGIEGLRQIIVRPDLQSEDTIDVFAAGGQDQHRNWRLLPDAAQHIKAAHPGEHQVEHYQRMLTRERPLKPAGAIMHGFDLETFVAHACREQLAELDVVIDDKHAIHGDLSPSPMLFHGLNRVPTFTKLYPA